MAFIEQRSCIPSNFALAMTESVGLYEMKGEFKPKFTDHDRLEVFQSVAVSSSFERSIAAAYFGRDLSKEQILILQLIFELTADWLVGKLSQNLIDHLDVISALKLKGKDVAEVSRTIMELLGIVSEHNKGKDSGTKTPADGKARMILEYTNEDKKPTDIKKNKSK
jgi:hypothetical protein